MAKPELTLREVLLADAYEKSEKLLREENRILRAALLWARNHLDVVNQDGIIDEVTRTLDRVLENREPSVADMKKFRKSYPRAPSIPKR